MQGKNIYICGVGGVWVQLLGSQGARARVILLLRKRIWNASAVSLVLLVFNDIGSLGFPPRRVGYTPSSSLGD